MCIEEEENMNQILKIEKPWINCYTTYAHMLSILQSDDRTYGWIFSNYIQIYLNKDLRNNSWGEFYRPLPYELMSFDMCKWLSVQKIRRELVVSDQDRLLNYLKNEIKNGYYVYLNIEHKCITSFENNGHAHDALVYGIDEDKQEVYVQDVFKKGRYESKILKMDEFVEAVLKCNIPENQDYLHGFVYSYKIREVCDYEFNENNIWNSLLQYFDAITPEYWNLYNNSNLSCVGFGMESKQSA